MRALAVAALALCACGAPVGGTTRAQRPRAHLRLTLREGAMTAEMRAPRPLGRFVLQDPIRIVSVADAVGPIELTTRRFPGGALHEGADGRGARTVRFVAEGLDDPLQAQRHVSEERVELGGWYWYPEPDAAMEVEVRSALPEGMRLMGSGQRVGDRWEIARGERFALVGIAEPGEARAARARLVYDAGWLDAADAQELAELASDAASRFAAAFGPVPRGALSIAMPPRQGGGYWTDGLLVVGQYYAGYGASDAEWWPIVNEELTAAGRPPPAPPSERPLAEVRMWRRYAVVHEVAHEWWHGYPEIAGWLSLDEGLAQYAVLMVADEAMREQALSHHVASLIDDALRTVPRPSGWDVDAYDRSPLFFLALENTFGADAVYALLRSIRQAHARGALDEPAFRQLLAARLGPRAVEMLDER